ncbi:MAG: hypothetical protein IPJ19_06510 [Planctomycetes bacterium]|nr:hypothetical protein [Planctomycetota bacterium]
MSAGSRRWLWALAILAGLLYAAKSLVCGVYLVETASMEPTIQGSRPGGERVLVVYGGAPPARFDPVVVLREGEAVPLVKRVVGLPSERVQIVDGDLLIDGARLGPDAPRPAAIPVFDERWQDPSAAFPIPQAAQPFWSLAHGEWKLVARSGVRAPNRLEFFGDVKDSYLDAEHALVEGEIPVNDLALALDLLQEEPGSLASFSLSEAGDVFDFEIARTREGKLAARILRRGEGDDAAPEMLASAELGLHATGWHRVRVSNIDNTLCLERDGRRVLVAQYEENRFAREDRLQLGHSLLPRLAFGGAGGELHFRGLRIERDLYYTPRGDYATHKAEGLGPASYFLLGDNSSQSRDGREWGETKARELIGRPVRVVWPLTDFRAIQGAVPPPPRLR